MTDYFTYALKTAITIAIRYSAVRKQFGPTSEEELPVLEYQMQVYRAEAVPGCLLRGGKVPRCCVSPESPEKGCSAGGGGGGGDTFYLPTWKKQNNLCQNYHNGGRAIIMINVHDWPLSWKAHIKKGNHGGWGNCPLPPWRQAWQRVRFVLMYTRVCARVFVCLPVLRFKNAIRDINFYGSPYRWRGNTTPTHPAWSLRFLICCAYPPPPIKYYDSTSDSNISSTTCMRIRIMLRNNGHMKKPSLISRTS